MGGLILRTLTYNRASPVLLTNYLKDNFPQLSAKYIANAILGKKVKVNENPVSYHYKLQKHDVIQIYFPTPQITEALQKNVATLDIVYEDVDLLIVNKPAGLLVAGEENSTLLQMCKSYLTEKYSSELAANARLCHRIDRGTCGLVMVAKTHAAFAYIYDEMKSQYIQKIYNAVVIGTPQKKQAVLHGFLTKDPKVAKVSVFSKPTSHKSVPIETQYSVLGCSGELSLLEITLITGRTHQIRAHLASIGTPVLGDGKYGDYKTNTRYRMKYQALFAKSLYFRPHEANGKNTFTFTGKTFTAANPWFITAFETNTW